MDVREAILRATIKLFAAAGSRGATTRRIAQEAGVNEVTLFRHFSTKEELIREALKAFADQASRALSLPATPGDPVKELTAWSRDHYKYLYKVRALIRKSMGEYEEHPENCVGCMKVVTAIFNELVTYLTTLQKRKLAAPDFDPRAAANLLAGSLFGDAMGREAAPDRYAYSMKDAVDKYLALFFAATGITTPPVRKGKREA
jgi:AcrR family transcriptional regulator